MNRDEYNMVNNTVLALLDCLAVFTNEMAGLIASDNLKYIDRNKLAEDISYIGSQITSIRNSMIKYNKAKNAQSGEFFTGPDGLSARNN